MLLYLYSLYINYSIESVSVFNASGSLYRSAKALGTRDCSGAGSAKEKKKERNKDLATF
jgi:hypothetical protein